MIATFFLCGFANLTSIGITLGGLSELFNSPRSSTCQADPALAHCKAEAR
ncbi:nucleoside transporter C-terminal domain-containing protein [Mycobacterium kansasii]